MDGYDVALICTNGHLINSSSLRYPSSNSKFCKDCGARAIDQCEECNNPIRGIYHITGVLRYREISVPSYCINCGTPYPWIKERIAAALELADLVDEISAEDKNILEESLDDIVRETPRSQIAALKFKKVISKMGSNVASAFRDILVDIASETAKKTIWPGS